MMFSPSPSIEFSVCLINPGTIPVKDILFVPGTRPVHVGTIAASPAIACNDVNIAILAE